MKVISGLNLKFETIEFRVTLPKHHQGIGAVERIIGSIKNTVSKSVSGPQHLIMDDEELLTWSHMVINKLNNRPLILGAPLGITLTPNHVLQGFKECYGDEINRLKFKVKYKVKYKVQYKVKYKVQYEVKYE